MSEWISVKDRLPGAGSRVVFCDVLKAMSIGYYDSSLGFHESVTHWMPLPEPPPPDLTTKEALKLALSILSDAEQSCRGARLVPIERWNPWFERYHSEVHRLRDALGRAGKPTVTYDPSGSVTITVPQEEA